MARRGIEGRRGFLACVGAVVALLGALVLAAVPAARHMDAKALDQYGARAKTGRARQVAVAGGTGIALGAGLVVFGLSWRRKG